MTWQSLHARAWKWCFRLLLAFLRLKFWLVSRLEARRSGAFALTAPAVGPAGAAYQARFFACGDGLRLHFRDYGRGGVGEGGGASPTVLCLHGLTRNAADFSELAETLASRGCRVIVPDQRGRGRSDWDPDPRHYRPDLYVRDTLQLIEALELGNVIVVGTSMGALMAIMLAALAPARFAGMVLNEAGPVIEKAGLEKLKAYLQNVRPATSWDDARAMCQAMYGPAFPRFGDDDWRWYADKTWFDDDGRPVAAWDPAIARVTVAQPEAAVPDDLWPLFDCAAGVPTLVIRGELSEILAADTVAAMCRRHPDCRSVTVAGVGHAPTLLEPEAREAILAFVARLGG